MAISDYNPSASLNTSISGIFIGEGMARGDVNAAMRQQMADIAVWRKGLGVEQTSEHGAVGDGVADDTAAITAAITAVKGTGKRLVFSAGTYLVSKLVFDGANYSVDTSAGVTFQQKSGLADGELRQIISVTGENISIGDLYLKGNIASDLYEFSHGVTLGPCKNVTIGRIYGTNIRGDVLYCYGRSTTPAENLYGGNIQSVSGTNVFRNLVTVTGGQVQIGSVIHDGPVGYRDIDIEPNVGAYQPGNLSVGFVKAGVVEIVSDDPTLQNEAFTCDVMDLDWTRIAATTPPYPGAPGVNSYAVSMSYCRSVQIGLLKIRDYKSYPVNLGASWDNIRIGMLDVANSNQTEAVFNSVIVQQGTAHRGLLDINYVKCVHAASSKWLVRANAGQLRMRVGGGQVTGGLLAVDVLGDFTGLLVDCGNSTGNATIRCNGSQFKNVSFTQAASAVFLYGCGDCTLTNVTGTFSSLFSAGVSASDNIFAVNCSLNGVYYRADVIGANAQNRSGTATFVAATAVSVTFAVAEANASYKVLITPNANKTFWVTGKGTGGFTINASSSSSDTVDWMMFR